MIRSILRSLAAVLAGMIAAIILIVLLEALGHHLFPPPPGIDTSSTHSLEEAMKAGKIPPGALASVLVGWVVAALGGSWVGARLAGRAPMAHGLTVGAIELALAIAMMLSMPHPLWIWAAALIGIPGAAWLGAWLAGMRPAAGAVTGGAGA